MTTTLVCWTANNYRKMIAAGLFVDRRVELLNGQVVEMSPEGAPHAELNNSLWDWFRDRLGQRAKVRGSSPIALGDRSELEPDVAIVRRRSYYEAHPVPEDIFLVVEISNTSFAKDTQEKVRIYAAAGIREYWVLDLRDRNAPSLVVYREPSESGYGSERRFTNGSIAMLAFPDVVLDLPISLDC